MPTPVNDMTADVLLQASLLACTAYFVCMCLAHFVGFKVPILTNLLFASADYTFRLERDAFITADTQFEHALMARANITLF